MSEERIRPWRILSSEYRIRTPFLRLRADRCELPGGGVVEDYFVRESRGFCIVLATTGDGRVVLVRQYKHGAAEIVLELPAGAIDPDETPEACARRELAEETGYTAPAFTHVRTFLIDPTSANGHFHLFLAPGAARTLAPDPDPTEEIEVVLAPLADLRAMALDGRIASGSQVASALVGLAALEREAGG